MFIESEPGSRMKYSGGGYVIAQMIIEVTISTLLETFKSEKFLGHAGANPGWYALFGSALSGEKGLSSRTTPPVERRSTNPSATCGQRHVGDTDTGRKQQ